MKTKFWIMGLFVIAVAAFVAQPILAQEESSFASCQMKGEKSCYGNGEDSALQEAEKPDQTKCPVMGGPVNKEVYSDYDGKRVYFCCAGCDKKFQENPEKYMEKMKEQGVVLENATCPVSGKPANSEIFTEYQGKKVYFCCEDCKDKFLESPEKYLKK